MGQPSSMSRVAPCGVQAASVAGAIGSSNQGSSPVSSSSVAPLAAGMGACQTIWWCTVAANRLRGLPCACHSHTTSPCALRKVMRYKCRNPARSAGSSRNCVRASSCAGSTKRRVWRSAPMAPVVVSLWASVYWPSRNLGLRLIRRGCELRLIGRDYELRLTRRDYELRLTRRGYELRLTRRGYELRLTRRSGTDSSIQKMELLRRGRHGACHGDELVAKRVRHAQQIPGHCRRQAVEGDLEFGFGQLAHDAVQAVERPALLVQPAQQRAVRKKAQVRAVEQPLLTVAEFALQQFGHQAA